MELGRCRGRWRRGGFFGIAVRGAVASPLPGSSFAARCPAVCAGRATRRALRCSPGQWMEDFFSTGTEVLRSHPRDAEPRHRAEKMGLLANTINTHANPQPEHHSRLSNFGGNSMRTMIFQKENVSNPFSCRRSKRPQLVLSRSDSPSNQSS